MSGHPYLLSLQLLLIAAATAWAVSVVKRDVSFVDSLWSLFFVAVAFVLAANVADISLRGMIVVGLVVIWSLRLSIYITARNWGEAEDYRYQAIRRKNDPGFAWKSLYLVFALQAVLAWFIAMPLWPAISSTNPLGIIDAIALLLWIVGFIFEAGGDYQLAKFRREKDSADAVLDTGLWRYTRHPNYFGDCCIWWAFFLFAVASGGWWTFASPLLMTFLLLKVSGVAMLEKTIVSRRPGYAEYLQRTPAFIPGPRRSPAPQAEVEV